MRHNLAKHIVLALLLISASCLLAESRPSADKVMKDAEARAAAEHKNIFLIFHASWCGWCTQLDRFLESPEIKPVIDKNFVVARLDVEEAKHPEWNNPGGEALMKTLGTTGGMPYLVFLDARGKPIVNSNRPSPGHAGGENIGYPVAPEEIAWFMQMLQKGAPNMTTPERKLIDDSLQLMAQQITSKQGH